MVDIPEYTITQKFFGEVVGAGASKLGDLADSLESGIEVALDEIDNLIGD